MAHTSAKLRLKSVYVLYRERYTITDMTSCLVFLSNLVVVYITALSYIFLKFYLYLTHFQANVKIYSLFAVNVSVICQVSGNIFAFVSHKMTKLSQMYP